MVYKFSIKTSLPHIEKLMDGLVENPYLILRDKSDVRRLGIYGRPLRKRKILHISPDEKLGESVALLKINNHIRPGSVKKKKGRKIDYIFEDTFVKDLGL